MTPRSRRPRLTRAERLIKAENLREQRYVERAAYHQSTPYQTAGGIAEHNQFFKTNLLEKARELLRIKKSPVRVLDLGAGEGILGLDFIKALGKKKIRMYGMGITRPYSRVGIEGTTLRNRKADLRETYRSYRVGDFYRRAQRNYGRQKFDLIVSSIFCHNAQEVLQIGQFLSPVGTAYIVLTSPERKKGIDTIESVRKKGFQVTIVQDLFSPWYGLTFVLHLVRRKI